MKTLLAIMILLIVFSCKEEVKKIPEENIPPVVYAPKSKAKFFEISRLDASMNKAGNLRHFISIYVENYDESNSVWRDIINDAYHGKPYSRGDFTAVFYFKDKNKIPIFKDRLDIIDNPKYEKNCVAGYWHYPSGEEKLTANPFK